MLIDPQDENQGAVFWDSPFFYYEGYSGKLFWKGKYDIGILSMALRLIMQNDLYEIRDYVD